VEQAETSYDLQNFNLILTDVRLPGAPGTDIIAKAEGVPVLVMTSYASVRAAVDAMKQGAVDYIAKPFDHDELLLLVERTLKQERLERRNEVMKSELDQVYPVAGMIGSCQGMREVCRRIARVAPTDTTVLILGESGTGKELVARALHDQSHRKDSPIVTVNCAAIPETLIESELFGHEKGAFTGADSARTGLVEAADGGTLFLDEIGELPQAAQARLLRVLQNGEIRRVGSEKSRQVDIRLIAATHRDLKQLVQESAFRSDLYFRLRVTPEAISTITAYDWPGNVRELENAMERAVILSDGDRITPELLAIDNTLTSSTSGEQENLSLEAYFRRFVLEHQEQMTETELARHLGISRKALWERRQRLDLPRSARAKS
jgi:DNA-binding NtrC family response regulator